MKEPKRHRDMADLEERKVKDVFRISNLDSWDSGSNNNERGTVKKPIFWGGERLIEF